MRTVIVTGGGGLNGLEPTHFLALCERKAPIRADLYVGNSTGGLIAAASAFGLTYSDTERIYRERGRQIFRANPGGIVGNLFRPKYGNEGLKAAIRATFGEGKRFGDAAAKVAVVTQYAATFQTVLLRSWVAPDSDLPIETALCATTAAPTYFPDCDGMLDGGLAANMPVHWAVVIARKLWPDEPFRVLSLACPAEPVGLTDKSNRGIIDWIRGANLVSAGMTGGCDVAIEVARVMMQEFGFPFLHIDPQEGPHERFPMDDPSQEAVETRLRVAERCLRQRGEEVLEFLA